MSTQPGNYQTFEEDQQSERRALNSIKQRTSRNGRKQNRVLEYV